MRRALRIMNKKITLIITSVAVIAIAVSALLVLANQNPKIFCQAEEQGTSSWYKSHDYETGEKEIYIASSSSGRNFTSLPNVDFGIKIINNNNNSLFDVTIEVTYRTIDDEWNTVTKTNIGFLDIQQSKNVKITLTNPYLTLWPLTKKIDHGHGIITWDNITIPVLNTSDCVISAYGFTQP